MIRHIVFFSAKNPEDLPRIVSELSRLKQSAHARLVEVSENERRDAWNNEVDVVVYAEFADLDALGRYKEDPLYKDVTAIVRPLRELRLSADYHSLNG